MLYSQNSVLTSVVSRLCSVLSSMAITDVLTSVVSLCASFVRDACALRYLIFNGLLTNK